MGDIQSNFRILGWPLIVIFAYKIFYYFPIYWYFPMYYQSASSVSVRPCVLGIGGLFCFTRERLRLSWGHSLCSFTEELRTRGRPSWKIDRQQHCISVEVQLDTRSEILSDMGKRWKWIWLCHCKINVHTQSTVDWQTSPINLSQKALVFLSKQFK